jgi:hypothetical protein
MNRFWNIVTHDIEGDAPRLAISLVCANPPHVVNIVCTSTLSAEDLGRAFKHLEDAADQHAHAVAIASEPRPRGVLSGSLSVHAADGTDITQPPSPEAA